MTRRVKVLRGAERDIATAMDWYRALSPNLPEDFLAEVDRAIGLARVRPLAFAKRHGEFRTVLLRRFPYAMYDRLLGTTVRVAAVLHQGRAPERLQQRLGRRRQT